MSYSSLASGHDLILDPERIVREVIGFYRTIPLGKVRDFCRETMTMILRQTVTLPTIQSFYLEKFLEEMVLRTEAEGKEKDLFDKRRLEIAGALTAAHSELPYPTRRRVTLAIKGEICNIHFNFSDFLRSWLAEQLSKEEEKTHSRSRTSRSFKNFTLRSAYRG